MTNRIPLIVDPNAAQIQEVSSTDILTVPGTITANIVQTDNYQYANGSPFSGGGSGGQAFVTSNIVSVTAGYPLNVEAVYGNSQYPAGVFTIFQSLPPTPMITVTDSWASTGTTSKNAYTDYANSVVNASNVNMTLSLSSSTFNIQSSDTITIGSATITGTDITSLGISGSGGTYSINSSLLGSAETAVSSPVSVNLTTAFGGPYAATGTTLATVQPVPFSLSSVSGSFANTVLAPGSNTSQPIQYAVSVSTGSILNGNIIITGNANSTTSTSTLTGNTANVNSTAGNFYLQASYSGNGLYGAGTTVSNVTTTVSPAVITLPMYIGNTPNIDNPNFTTSTTHFGNTWIPAPGAPGNTYGILTNWNNPTTEYYWLGIPDSLFWGYQSNTSGGLNYLYDTQLGIVQSSFNAAYGNGTDTFGGSGGNVTIGDQPYVVLGFTGFANIADPSSPANLFLYVSTSTTS